MNRNIVRFGVLVLACLAAVEFTTAQTPPDPWYGRQVKPKNFDSAKVFTGAFSVELPKDWQLAPGHTGTVFSIVEKTKRSEIGALITLEYMRLQAPLEPALIPKASERELGEVQTREASGKQFSGAVKTGERGPIILIQYDRPGVSGSDDHVVQYSMPTGTTMYRLICIAPTAAVEKYRPIFAHVAASFTPLKPTGS
jgi:hypothetical protein